MNFYLLSRISNKLWREEGISPPLHKHIKSYFFSLLGVLYEEENLPLAYLKLGFFLAYNNQSWCRDFKIKLYGNIKSLLKFIKYEKNFN